MIGQEIGDPFAAFADVECWVCWRTEMRKGKPTKVPYMAAAPGLRLAKVDDRGTWATRDIAMASVSRILEGHEQGGIGIILGLLGAGSMLVGIDLDSCLIDGKCEQWAIEVIEALGSYTEISPSGTGVKIFGLLDPMDVDALRTAMGTPHGRQFKRGGGEHPPAIELHVSNRYFTVTGRVLPDTPAELRQISRTTLLWVITEAGPRFVNGGEKSANSGNDQSRSGAAFRVARTIRSNPEATFEQMVAALLADPQTAEWVADKGETNNSRELRRLWDRAVPVNDTASNVPVRYSENALAAQFTEEHADSLLFVHEWGMWLAWDGGRWRQDHGVRVYDLARLICAREGNAAMATISTGGKKIAAVINRAATISAIERLTRHHHRHVRIPADFDADPLMLNTPSISLDLRDVILPERPHRREDYLTRSTAIAPAETADCPLWLEFLARIMGGAQDMVDYLQRVCGYMLTGSTAEHVLFFGHGAGANGKSTFSNVLLGILGTGESGYAAVAPISTFTASLTDQHPTELAMLKGVRCVIAQETEENRAWAVSKLKVMTGGDAVTARFMRQDFFTFQPAFKLLILGNHKPAIKTVDEALRRRIHMIPFLITIPPEQRDSDLGEKLKPEYPAILRWMIAGCAAWQIEGLNPPATVIDATRNYLVDEDTLAAWISECCWVGDAYYGTLVDLFASWKSWAEANGEKSGTRKDLTKALDSRSGLSRREQAGSGRTGWDGIVARPPGTV